MPAADIVNGRIEFAEDFYERERCIAFTVSFPVQLPEDRVASGERVFLRSNKFKHAVCELRDD